MIFTADKNLLMIGLNAAIKAVPSRTTMPILECILINAEDDKLTLSANDMEMAIQTSVDANVEEPGTICVDAKMFLGIVSKMPDHNILFESNDEMIVTLKSGKSKFTIPGRESAEFTGVPTIEPTSAFVISQYNLKTAIMETLFCIDASGKNRVMSGEHFVVTGNELSVTAIDGQRIAIRNVEIEESAGDADVIIPGKALGDISRILSNDHASLISISVAKNHIRFKFDNTVMTARLIDGNYYDMSNILKYERSTKIVGMKSDIIACTERAGLFVKEGDKKPIILEVTQNNLQFSIQTQTGEMSESLELVTEGNDTIIGFNPKFILDALKVVPDDEVSIYMDGSKKPCYIMNANKSYVYVILPVNISK